MRVHRITLRNYRGVDACELAFADQGVTVVAGNNEVGKSSAAEALHLLLEHRDDTTRAAVRAVRAVHLDAGAEVEAELSVGGHRFVYAKRWHRDRYTRLKVLGPQPQVLTGREAHDRVRALLAGSVDLDLWRALSVPQAAALDQAALRDHPSLVAALDAAAGGDLGSPDDGQLLARAEAEAARWFTPTGRPRGALAELRAAAAEASAEVTACRAAIDRLEADVAWCADLQRSADELAARRTEAVAAAAAASAHLAELQQRHAAIEGLAVAADLAETRAAVAATAVDARRRAVAELEAATAARADARAAVALADDAAAAAAADLVAAKATAGASHDELARAVEATEVAAGWHERLTAAASLATLEARQAAAGGDAAALAAARAALAANPSSPGAVAAVQAAHDDVVRAEAALAAEQATVRVEALADVTLQVDGATQHRVAGSVTEHGVAGASVLELPGALRVVVAAGAGAVGLATRLEAAEEVLAARCRALGVADLAGAQALERERHQLAAAADACRVALTATLAGTSVDALRTQVERARQALDAADRALATTGRAAPPAGGDADPGAARQALDRATAAERDAERAAARAAAGASAAEAAHEAAAAAALRSHRELAVAEARWAACTGALAGARAELSDEALDAARRTASARSEAATLAWRAAAAAAAQLDLPGAAAEARRTATERTGVERSLAQVREDLAGVRARLEVQGEGGHHGRLAEATRRAVAINEDLTSVEARAAAAQLLVATLTHHRDEAARAYGAPLRVEIERLGRLVFGPGFGVVLDDDLRIAARTLDGVPVPWSDLSVGAREQLAVLSRLAVAMLVSPDGGVPVIFDDVLGFSDPSRLALVAAAFEAAAAHCQIIVLTCDADRYRHLPRAATHHLTAPRAVGSRQAG